MIELRVQPGPAITRVAFLQTHPPYSIALDGYVHGAPFLDVRNDGPRRNFKDMTNACAAAVGRRYRDS
ncbi:MAG: hypothetical protein IPJ61_19430 [Tessaracoccus sp.]|uniref:hypothetical protein n=1 Tax=Tessaracoccus sp. TaxID=1971211 RepID=UPI001EC4997D|nr:hypothetical protein [Tessaracoccus sp.]MBK7823160.1 hypothetical protein [Tessaracoccus sp.]